MTGANVAYVSVPEHGMTQVLDLVRRELESRELARQAYSTQMNRRRSWRRVNGRDLDLM